MNRFAVFAIFLVFAPLPAAADTAGELQKVESALREKQNAAAAAAKAAAEAQRELVQLQEKLRAAAKEEAALQDQLDDMTVELGSLREQTAAVRQKLDATAKTETSSLGILLRLGQLPPAAWWFYDGVSIDQERRMLLLRTAARGLDAQAADLRQNLLTADRLKARLAAKQDELVTAKSMLQSKQDELNDLIAARRALAATHQAEQAELLRDTAKLTATAADLRGLLDNMTRKKKQTGRPAILQARPDITLPVAGRVTRAYGVRDRFGVNSRGVTIAGKPGGWVVAPQGGKVVFAGPFKGYGNILILQHMGEYHSLLAGFGKIDVNIGQSVMAGEPIGSLKQRGDAAELYFELRRNGNPIDPLLVQTPQRGRKR